MGHPSRQPDFATPPSPWTRPWFIAAAAFLGLVVVGGLIVALVPGDDGDPPRPAPTTGGGTGQAAPPATAPDGSASALPTVVPTVPPTDVTWQLVGQTAVPVSAAAGPRSTASGVASGYAHTPVGALIAAAQLSTRSGFSAGRGSWEPTISRQFVPGADRDRLLETLRAQPGGPAEPGELSALAGYLYQSYTPDTAVIGLVYRAPGGGTARYHVLTVTMLWRDGDWMMVPRRAGRGCRCRGRPPT